MSFGTKGSQRTLGVSDALQGFFLSVSESAEAKVQSEINQEQREFFEGGDAPFNGFLKKLGVVDVFSNPTRKGSPPPSSEDFSSQATAAISEPVANIGGFSITPAQLGIIGGLAALFWVVQS